MLSPVLPRYSIINRCENRAPVPYCLCTNPMIECQSSRSTIWNVIDRWNQGYIDIIRVYPIKIDSMPCYHLASCRIGTTHCCCRLALSLKKEPRMWSTLQPEGVSYRLKGVELGPCLLCPPNHVLPIVWYPCKVSEAMTRIVCEIVE